MPSAINADNGVVSGTAGLKSSADNSGVLDLQTNGTTAISISASQVVTFANQPAYTGGTANGVLYLNASKVLTSGSALTFDGTNLGIGTGSPSQKLDVQAPTSIIVSTSTTGTNSVRFVQNNTGGQLLVGIDNSAGSSAFGVGAYAAGVWYTGAYPLVFATNNTERARISSGGNFGIGTNSPLIALHVVGTGNANSIMTNQVVRFASTANAINFGDDGTDGLIGVGNSGSNLSLLSRVAGVYSKALTVNSDSTIKTATTISVGNATPTTSGAGITFPATQSASSNANTLDDYEEGTWTPVLRGAGTAGSYTLSIDTNGATYTKVGRLVTVNCSFVLTTIVSAGTAYAQVTGLPFANAGQISGSCYFQNVTVDASTLWCDVQFISATGQTIVYFNTIRNGTSSVDTLISGFAAGCSVRFAITYIAST